MAGNRKGSEKPPKSELHKDLGDALAKLREARRLTQREFAALAEMSPGYISAIENGLQAPSSELVSAYAKICGANAGPLYDLLERIRHQVQVKGQARRIAGKATSFLTAQDFYSPPNPAALYYVVTSDVRLTLDEQGIGKDTRVTLSIRAKVPGVDRFFTGWGYNGNDRPGVVSPVSGFGCSMGEFVESSGGAVQGYFKLSRPLDPAAYEFSFRMLFNATTRAEPPMIAQFKADAQRHAVAIQFTEPALPEKVWWFDADTSLEVQVDPQENCVFSPDSGGYYYKEFIGPRAGRLYGIDYQWSRIEV